MFDVELIQDPAWQFLRIRNDVLFKEQAARDFDNSSHRWIADPIEGFIATAITVIEDDQLTLRMPDNTLKKLNVKETQEISLAKLEKAEQMAHLSFINEASVLHNLRQRYRSMLTYTYSGSFCVFINPNKLLPIYTDSVATIYIGHHRTQMPPHIFASVDESYRNLIYDGRPQSILLTGESGSGKTENAKAVMFYLSKIARGASETQRLTEQRILKANLLIEAFGNAATKRNCNSSRFSKFLRIFFNKGGTMIGAHISHYHLEKPRITKQLNGERSFHIFYQILSSGKQRDLLSLADDANKYRFASQSGAKPYEVNDAEEFERTYSELQVIGFSEDEISALFKLCAAIIHIGAIRFVPNQSGEGIEEENADAVDSAARLLGVQKERFLEAILRPTIDVSYGRVTKIESLLKVANTIETLTSVIYKRLFAWLVERCNSVLMADVKSNSTNSIGILDIAGFKVLEHDSFELLWRNLLNEKMQQYVNEQMFIEAQEEYQREALGWQLIDFGHNRQSCIDLIEKCPLGIVSLLEEECALQNGDETAFVQKLKNIYLGKNHYLLDELSTVAKQSKSYFAIRHFAGIVHYNAVGWIEKNKDVLSESLVSVLKSSHKDTLTNRIFAEYSSKLDIWTRVLKGTTVTQKRSERVTLRSISHSNRESLYNLMKMLEVTTPHFVRCIVANRDNVSGMIDATLVLNQIAYNGILEAARIYRKGFSNQIEFFKFHRRYSILTPEESASSKDDRHVADAMLRKLVRHLRMPITQFHVGKTKVFLKSELAAKLDELRDKAITIFAVKLQSFCHHYLALAKYNHLLKQREAIKTIQRNVLAWTHKCEDQWLRLVINVINKCEHKRSNIKSMQISKEELKNTDLSDELELVKIRCEYLEEVKASLSEKIDELEKCLRLEKKVKEEAYRVRKRLENELKQSNDRCELITKERNHFGNECKRKEKEILNWRTHADEDANLITKLQINIRRLVARIEELEEGLQNEQNAKSRAERQCAVMQAELDTLSEQIAATNGQLSIQLHLNKLHQLELNGLHHELDKRSVSRETHIAELCSMQSLTLNSLRNLIAQADSLEKEASRVLSNRYVGSSGSSVVAKGDPSDSDDS